MNIADVLLPYSLGYYYEKELLYDRALSLVSDVCVEAGIVETGIVDDWQSGEVT